MATSTRKIRVKLNDWVETTGRLRIPPGEYDGEELLRSLGEQSDGPSYSVIVPGWLNPLPVVFAKDGDVSIVG